MFDLLAAGDSVAVVAPAGPAPAERYARGLALLSERYRILRPYQPDGDAPRALPYLASDDDARVRAFNEALADPAVRAIFTARGGYGCTRIVDRLDLHLLAERRLPLVGFSDITALHVAAQRAGAFGVHGPVVNQLPLLPQSQVDGLFALLEGRSRPRLDGLTAIRRGRARGPLRGGNLALLAALCGTAAPPVFAGAIVLLEDVGEPPYRIDRLLTQLLAAGAFGHAAGIVLGDFVDGDAMQGLPLASLGRQGPPVTAFDVLAERLAPLGIPIVAGAPVGHGRDNVALPLGLEATLDATAGTLTFDEDR